MKVKNKNGKPTVELNAREKKLVSENREAKIRLLTACGKIGMRLSNKLIEDYARRPQESDAGEFKRLIGYLDLLEPPRATKRKQIRQFEKAADRESTAAAELSLSDNNPLLAAAERRKNAVQNGLG